MTSIIKYDEKLYSRDERLNLLPFPDKESTYLDKLGISNFIVLIGAYEHMSICCHIYMHRRRGTFTRGGAMTLILPSNSKVYLNFTY